MQNKYTREKKEHNHWSKRPLVDIASFPWYIVYIEEPHTDAKTSEITINRFTKKIHFVCNSYSSRGMLLHIAPALYYYHHMVIEGKDKPFKASAPQEKRPPPVARISKIASLKKFPDTANALDLLHNVAKAVAPIIHEHRFDVGLLCEMDPKNPCLLGLNVNRGQKILLRLRPSHDKTSFYPMGDLIGTFLHELCHNVHGPHNSAFYDLLKSLKTQFETRSYKIQYFSEENRLGSSTRDKWLSVQRVRAARLKNLDSGVIKSESRRLGGSVVSVGDRRAAALEAAERRRRHNQWCTEAVAGDIPSGENLQIQDFIDLTGEDGHFQDTHVPPKVEVIDLTGD